MSEAGLCQGDHIHVALGDDHRAARAGGLAGQGPAVQDLALVKQRCLRAVQVLCRSVAKRTATKGDDAATAVMDRKTSRDGEKRS